MLPSASTRPSSCSTFSGYVDRIWLPASGRPVGAEAVAEPAARRRHRDLLGAVVGVVRLGAGRAERRDADDVRALDRQVEAGVVVDRPGVIGIRRVVRARDVRPRRAEVLVVVAERTDERDAVPVCVLEAARMPVMIARCSA